MTHAGERFVRYRRAGLSGYGLVDGDLVRELDRSFLEASTPTGTEYPLSSVGLLWPVDPPKILCVGRNYKSHLGDRPQPEVPAIFYKPKTALAAPEGDVVLPRDSKDVHYEGELVIVIGKGGKDIAEETALDHVFGYTCGNDVSERNWQHGSLGDKKDVQWWRAKGSDTFAPLGPWVVRSIDYATARLETRVNGEVKQSQLVSDMIFPPAELVSFISRYVTLEAGDVIYTGTPGNTTALAAGDRVEVSIEGIGVLGNSVVGA